MVHPRRRVVFALYVTWILTLTLAPLPAGAGRLPDWFDKVVHGGLFLGFAALLYWNGGTGRWPRGVWVIGLSAAFAAAIELAQGPLVFRTGDVWDFVWGVVGAALGFGVAKLTLAAAS